MGVWGVWVCGCVEREREREAAESQMQEKERRHRRGREKRRAHSLRPAQNRHTQNRTLGKDESDRAVWAPVSLRGLVGPLVSIGGSRFENDDDRSARAPDAISPNSRSPPPAAIPGPALRLDSFGRGDSLSSHEPSSPISLL